MLFLLQSLFSSCYGHKQPEKQGSWEPEKNVAGDGSAQCFKGINQLSWLIHHTGSDIKFRSRTSSLAANSWNLVKGHIYFQDYLSVSRLARNLQSIQEICHAQDKKANITEDRDFSRSLLFPVRFFDVVPGGVVDHSAQMCFCQELKSPPWALYEIWRLFPGRRCRAGMDFSHGISFWY